MKLTWGRDPFMQPDTEGPAITAPKKPDAARNSERTALRITISDVAVGNSGVAAATLFYGKQEPYDEYRVEGVHETKDNGDGEWVFNVPTPKEPVQCWVSAQDNSQLRNTSRSSVFTMAPPVRETADTRIGETQITLTLRGITWSGSSGVALINSDVCSVGDVVNGCKVVKIMRDSVVLTRDGHEIVLQLKE